MKEQERMQKILNRLGIPLTVSWNPNPEHNQHGLIEKDSRTLFIFDVDSGSAWQTFMHEILEWKLTQATRVYRTIINSLMETLEKVAYQNKESCIEFLPRIFREVEEEKRRLKNG